MTRRRAAMAALAAIVAGLAAVNTILLLQPEQVERRAQAALEAALGFAVSAEGLRRHANGDLELERLLLWPGRPAGAPAGLSDDAETRPITLANVTRRREPSLIPLMPRRPARLEIEEATLATGDLTALVELLRRRGLGGRRGRDGLTLIAIGRLTLHDLPGDLPLLAAPPEGPLVLDAIELRPDSQGEHLWRLELTWRPDQLERLSLTGLLDLEAQTASIEVHASNLQLRPESLSGAAPYVRERVAELEPDGPLDLHLTATMPWTDPARTRLSGRIECYALTLRPPALPRPITNISGRVVFDGASARVEGLRGVYGGAEMRLRGAIRDLRAMQGVDLDLSASGLALADLRGLPLAAPLQGSFDLAALEGRGLLHLRLETREGEDMADAELVGELTLQQAAAFGGALQGVVGRVAFRRPAASQPSEEAAARPLLEGAVWLERGNLHGAPLEQVTGRLRVTTQRASLDALRGALAGGRLVGQASADTAGSVATASLDVHDARAAELTPALLPDGHPMPGRISAASIRLERTGERGSLRGRVEARVEGFDPFGADLAAPLAQALADAGLARRPFRGGQVTLHLGEAGPRLSAQLLGRDHDVAIEVEREPGGALRGQAAIHLRDGARLSFEVGGTVAAPILTPRS